MSSIFQGCLRKHSTDLSCCSVTHITEGVWTQQLTKMSGIRMLAQGAAGDRKHIVVTRTSAREGRSADLEGRGPDTFYSLLTATGL